MAQGLNIDYVTLATFLALFAVFAFLGFYGAKWRKGDLSKLDEWGLGGRRLGWLVVWFLLGADLFTAYTFIAVPSAFLAKGAIYWFAVPYVAWGFGVALLTMPRLWTVAKNKGYVTASDFVKGRFNNRALAIAVALTGVVAELPYIALQIVGMEAVLAVLLIGLGVSPHATVMGLSVTDISLILAFIVLAAFTITSGLRGAALSGIFKDVLVWITVIAVALYIPLIHGGYGAALSAAQTYFSHPPADFNKVVALKSPLGYTVLPSQLYAAYFSLALGSAFALYLYPHAINGSLSSEDKEKLKLSTSLMPIYGIGLALITLFGILVYLVPAALNLVITTRNGSLVVPALVAASMPDWFVGLAFLAIFIGGLVPAAIMAIGVANLLTRNVIGEFTKLSPTSEAKLAKILSTVFKFVALAFVFVVPPTYAIQLQLLGGILISQTLPAVFIGLFTDKLEGNSTLAGWAVGMGSGIYLTLLANHFSALTTSFFSTPLGLIYIALIALGLNLAVTVVGTLIARALGWRPTSAITAQDLEVEAPSPATKQK
ncbi:sodium:solute symporter family protein [Stygiolobus caldivivus]|uniref:Sodium:solute symporter n=1 Tax=Stygiolobus caldivivus TaxID=2824673 RepID=A0A8D5ZI42_9CREN|nr:sodium:solute symporter [Stygiolobus caldivivus]BCU68957.1 sodium:solute symporter [Stygiolobus caldivivus]